MKKIGSKLKDLRHKKGLSCEKLAAKVGVSHSTIANYENDKNITLQLLVKICKALNIDIKDLL